MAGYKMVGKFSAETMEGLAICGLGGGWRVLFEEVGVLGMVIFGGICFLKEEGRGGFLAEFLLNERGVGGGEGCSKEVGGG